MDGGGQGHATYHLRVKMRRESSPLGLFVSNFPSVCSVWVDGRRIAESGTLGTDRNSERPRAHFLLPTFSPRSDIVDIVLQVSNYHSPSGGVGAPVWLGSAENIARMRLKDLAGTAFLVGAILIIGFFHLVKFGLRNEDRANLLFGLFCLAWATHTAFASTGGWFMSAMIPELSWQITLVFDRLPYALAIPLLVMFHHALFPEGRRTWIPLAYAAAGGVTGVLVLVLPQTEYMPYFLGFHLLAMTSALYLTALLIKDSMQGKLETLFLIPGYVILGLTGFNDILRDFDVVSTAPVVHWGVFALIISYFFVVSHQSAQAWEKALQLARTLQENFRLKDEVERLEQAECDLRIMQQRLSAMLDSVEDAVAVIDENGEVVFCNASLNSLTGGRGCSLGSGLADLFPPEESNLADQLAAHWLQASPDSGEVGLHPHATIRKRDGLARDVDLTTTLLEVEEEPLLLLIIREREPVEPVLDAAPGTPTLALVDTLNRNRNRLFILEEALSGLAQSGNGGRKGILRDLRDIDTSLARISQTLSETGQQASRRSLAAHTMHLCLEYWAAGGGDKYSLARQSGLWKVYVDKDGGQRTQTMDKYLDPARMPKYPRYMLVIKTADFVLAASKAEHPLRMELETSLANLRQG